jgi:hypothetical protein
VGEIGYNRNEFLYDLKLWEIRSIIRGYRMRERTIWDSTRWQTWLILCGMGSKSLYEPTDLAKFPWDNQNEYLPSDDVIDQIRQEIIEENKLKKTVHN